MGNRLFPQDSKTPSALSQHFLHSYHFMLYFLNNQYFISVFGHSARVLRFSPVAQPPNFFCPPLPPENYPLVGIRFSTVSTYPFYYCLFLILVSFFLSSSQCRSANVFNPTFLGFCLSYIFA